MIRVKVCGITRLEDALHAAAVGADLLGFVFAPSPRRCELAEAARISARLAREHPRVARVGVFVDPSIEELARAAAEAHLTHLQIHGRRPAELPAGLPWIAALGLARAEDARLPPGEPWAVLVEPKVEGKRGGTGERLAWEWVEPLLGQGRLFVAGGLDGEAVGALLERVQPFGVDASSALERSPGVKDPEKVRAFVEAVRRHEIEEGETR